MNFNLKNSALLIALSLTASVTLAASANAYQCKNNFQQVESIAKLKATAKASGRSLWTSSVKSSYGLEWSVWNIAANDSQSCEHTGNNWYCTTKAKPCLYVVQ